MKNIYLIGAIIGSIVPYLFFFQFIQTEGLNLIEFSSSLFVNGAACGFSADLLITSFVFWAYMFSKVKDGQPKPYVFIALNLTIGLSCSLPAYLYWIEKSKK